MAQASSLVYFYADLLTSSSGTIKEKLSEERVTFRDVVSMLDKTSSSERKEDFDQNLSILKVQKEKNEEEEAVYGLKPGFLSCVSQAGENGGLVYTVTVSTAFKRILVTFRGSTTTEDWMKNLQLIQKEIQYGTTTVYVHKGFNDYLDEKYAGIKEHLDELQNEYSHCDLYITGHSLGGAIATLFAYRFACDSESSVHKTPFNLVTFASPHVGDERFATAFKNLEKMKMIRHTRVAISSDPIPKVLAVAPYLRLLGKVGLGWAAKYNLFLQVVSRLLEILLDGKGSDRVDTYHHVGEIMSLGTTAVLFDAHSMGTYIACISEVLEELKQ